jgi:DNA-binding transcriptional regulator GbsR (MarR family)
MTPELTQFAKRMNEYSIAMGLPPSVAKVLTYLTLCQPALQTAVEIQTGTGISAGSASEALAMLRQVELIERKKLPGTRQFYYEVTADGWKKATMHRFRMLDQGIELAGEGLSINPGNERLQSMHDMYSIFSREFADFEKRFL